jgi:hypothetical protein
MGEQLQFDALDGIGSIDGAQPTKLDFRTLGASGLRQQGGFVYEGTREVLRGKRAIQTYGIMAEQDPSAATMRFMIDNIVRGVGWFVREFSDDAEGIENKQFLESCLDDMDESFDDTISSNLSMTTYGFAPHEICYKVRAGDADEPWRASKFNDGKVGWKSLALRSQDTLLRWEFDETGTLQGMWQQAPPLNQAVFIPIDKLLLFRTSNLKQNPEGESMFRRAYDPWLKKRKLEAIEGIAIERDLCGLPVVQAPPQILSDHGTPDQLKLRASLRKMITEIRTDQSMGLMFPLAYDKEGREMFKFSLMNSGGARSIDVSKVIERYDTQIFRTSLTDFLTLGQGSNSGGSWAMHSDKTQIFLMSLKTYLAQIKEVYNRQAIPRLFQMNGISAKGYPEIDHTPLEQVDMQALAAALNSLATSGMPLWPNPDVQRRVLEILGLPAAVEEPGGPNAPRMHVSGDTDKIEPIYPHDNLPMPTPPASVDPAAAPQDARPSTAPGRVDPDAQAQARNKPKPPGFSRFG